MVSYVIIMRVVGDPDVFIRAWRDEFCGRETVPAIYTSLSFYAHEFTRAEADLVCRVLKSIVGYDSNVTFLYEPIANVRRREVKTRSKI